MRGGIFCGVLWLLLAPGTSIHAEYDARPALQVDNPQQRLLLDISRAGERLVAVGEHGIVILSDDNGRSWRQAEVPVSELLTAVHFVDAQYGWAAGHSGVILHSRDAGETWHLQLDGDRTNRQWLDYAQAQLASLEAQQAPDADALDAAGFAVEDAQLALETGPADPFLDIWFADRDFGIAVGAYGMLYRTEDGGAHWRLGVAGIDNPERYHYFGITAQDQGLLFLSGEAGLIYRSDDGGNRWQRLDSGYDGSLFGVVATGDAVLAYGLRGNILRSVDGGDSWQILNDAADASLYGGNELRGGSVALVGAGGQVVISQDSGLGFVGDQHSSRSSFTGVVPDKKGGLLLVGMSGVVHMDTAGAKEQAP